MKLFVSSIIILLSSITGPTDPGDVEGQDEDQSEDDEEQEGDN